jgi:hypothetical protein
LGEAIEHCRERGLDVRAITDGASADAAQSEGHW